MTIKYEAPGPGRETRGRGKAPIGAIVGITYDGSRFLDEGDILQTPSGRVYQIVALRRQTRGIHTGRWHLKCLVLGEGIDAIPPQATVYPLYWYARSPKGKGSKTITSACA